MLVSGAARIAAGSLGAGGGPIGGAVLTLAGTGLSVDEPPVFKSSADGRFLLPDLIPGVNYSFEVACIGFEPAAGGFCVPAPEEGGDQGLDELANVEMAVLTFSMSGLVLSAQVGAAPIILAGTSVTVMKVRRCRLKPAETHVESALVS